MTPQMSSRLFRAIPAGAVILFLCCAGCANSVRHSEKADAAEMSHGDWANLSINLLIDKYGPPSRVETHRLVWEKKGPWKRIVVWDMMGFNEGDFEVRNIEQTLAYQVPSGRRIALHEFKRGVHMSIDGSELSARSASEEVNFLALNVADEIVKGVKSPSDARRFYDQTIKLSETGKTSPYMKGLLFHPEP